MWQRKISTVPEIVGALGMIKKVIDRYFNKTPDSPNLYELQKMTLSGTAHFPREVLWIWQKNITQKGLEK